MEKAIIRRLFNTWRLGDAAVATLLTGTPPAVYDPTCYLYNHFATTGMNAGTMIGSSPIGENRFAQFWWGKFGGGLPMNYLQRIGEGIPMNGKLVTSVDVSVTGAGWSAATPQAETWGGNYRQSTVANDSISCVLNQGTTLGLSLGCVVNGGFGLVAIDSDYTLANLLPKVTQALINLGYFAQADLDKRYIDCYKSTGGNDWDRVIGIAEGLSDINHTVTILVKGTSRGGSGQRVYVSAFFAGRAATKPTDANARMVPTKFVYFDWDAVSSMINVVNFAPSSAPANFQFMGEGHGNEALVSEQWQADAVNVAPAAGAYSTGKNLTYTRVTTYNHPSLAGVGTRRVISEIDARRPMALKNYIRIEWASDGNLSASYAAMLPLGEKIGDFTYTNEQWPNIRIAGQSKVLPQQNLNQHNYKYKTDSASFYSNLHDVVVTVQLPNLDAAVKNWKYSSEFAFVEDRASPNTIDKFYMMRSAGGTAATLEPVKAGDVMEWHTNYDVRRIKNAATNLNF